MDYVTKAPIGWLRKNTPSPSTVRHSNERPTGLIQGNSPPWQTSVSNSSKKKHSLSLSRTPNAVPLKKHLYGARVPTTSTARKIANKKPSTLKKEKSGVRKSLMLVSDGSPDPRHTADVNFPLHTTVCTTNLKQHSVCPTKVHLPSALAW